MIESLLEWSQQEHNLNLKRNSYIPKMSVDPCPVGSTTLPHSHIPGSPWQRSTDNMKRRRNQRVIEIEKSSFNPLVFTTTGGMAPECNRVKKRLAEKIAEKRREPYASVIKYIRTKLRFALLRSTLAAIRGFRGKRSDVHLQDLTDIDFSLIPRPTVT